MKRRYSLQLTLFVAIVGIFAGLHSLSLTANGLPLINIDGARQLFVDDYLIQSGVNIARTYHQTVSVGPVLSPDEAFEDAGQPGAAAMAFSDGLIWDRQTRQFRLYYMAGLTSRHQAFATSADGRTWHKRGTVITGAVQAGLGTRRDTQTVVFDPTDPIYPYKGLRTWSGGQQQPADLLRSRDGIAWEAIGQTPPVGDRTTFFYDPFIQQWIFSIRGSVAGAGGPYDPDRVRFGVASPTFFPSAWYPQLWVKADAGDWAYPGGRAQLYNLDVTAYEGIRVGLFGMFRGDVAGMPKPNDITIGFSRDLLNWHRPDRRAFIAPSMQPGTWNHGNVQSVGGGFAVMGDQLLFYHSGREGVPGTMEHGVSRTGLSVLRRDGFASISGSGSLTTHAVQFSGRHLFVNYSGPGLQVEILDGSIDHSYITSLPVSGDSTRQIVSFPGLPDLSPGIGMPLRFKFHLNGGTLYSFWVSNTVTGKSGGYLAAGGPEANFYGRDQ